jgi:two-component system chemotaxis response regulator CheB
MTTPGRKITAFVVDDSAVSRDLITRVLESESDIEVVGCACNGAEAVAALKERTVDVVTMDIHMPGMDGYEATRQIMESRPLPIVIVTASFDPGDVAKTFRTLEAGAVAAVEKPPGPGNPAHAAHARKLIDMVKAMSEVQVVRRWPRARMKACKAEPPAAPRRAGEIRLVAIGASTGGPPVLQTVLAGLPKPCPVPVVIVQHISAGFTEGLADWLTATTGLSAQLARHGEFTRPGAAYLAPDGCQMSLGRDFRIACEDEPAEHGLRPSASFLFRKVAQHFGAEAAGVLLTGMGCDGAEELKLMRDAGAVTFAQDKESSIVHGMPGEAIRLGAAMHVGPPERIAALLHSLLAPHRSHHPL